MIADWKEELAIGGLVVVAIIAVVKGADSNLIFTVITALAAVAGAKVKKS